MLPAELKELSVGLETFAKQMMTHLFRVDFSDAQFGQHFVGFGIKSNYNTNYKKNQVILLIEIEFHLF